MVVSCNGGNFTLFRESLGLPCKEVMPALSDPEGLMGVTLMETYQRKKINFQTLFGHIHLKIVIVELGHLNRIRCLNRYPQLLPESLGASWVNM